MTTSAVCGRFAPTPSGALHVGSARTAVASALSAWSQRGSWRLRVEDLDAQRSAPEATAAMLDDLRWMGLDWDGDVVLQRPRLARHTAALRALRAIGRVYPCACSRRDVELAAQAPHGAEPVYPGTCRDADPEGVVARAAALGRGVAWRFRTDPEAAPRTIADRFAGPFTQDVAAEVGDFIVTRSDGVPAYQLAVVVDDIDMGVTEVLRGDDLLPSTPRQALVYDALGACVPAWSHIPLVLDGDGERLAKRRASMGIAALRARGTTAAWLRGWILESLGLRDPGGYRAAAEAFSLASIPRAPVRWHAPA